MRNAVVAILNFGRATEIGQRSRGLRLDPFRKLPDARIANVHAAVHYLCDPAVRDHAAICVHPRGGWWCPFEPKRIKTLSLSCITAGIVVGKQRTLGLDLHTVLCVSRVRGKFFERR